MRESRSYDPELYRKVKESVTMQQAVEYCGLRVIRINACARSIRTSIPSMKIYPDGKGYYCFACGSGGDQVKFVARYLGVNNYDAAKELAQAFGIPIEEPVTYREKREAEKKKRCRREKDEFTRYARKWLMVYRSSCARRSERRTGISGRGWAIYRMWTTCLNVWSSVRNRYTQTRRR